MTQIQLLQKRVARGVKQFEKDDKQDMALLRAYQNGNEDAGMQLVENYVDLVSHIYRYPFNPPRYGKRNSKFAGKRPHITEFDREDLMQEILLQFFVLLNEYDADTGKPLQAILKGKLHHRVYDNFFREFLDVHHNEVRDDEYLNSLSEEDTTSKLFVNDIMSGIPSDHLELYQALNKLGKRQREVFLLSEVNGWNATEIAKELGVSASTVRSNKEFALRRLRELLAKEDE